MEDLSKRLAELREGFKTKYANVINDLSIKYNKDVGIGFDMLEAIARANILEKEAEYSSEVEFNMEELVNDYLKIEFISNEINKIAPIA